MSDSRCRHRNFWAICGGSLLWCYECGALRRMSPMFPEMVGPWTKPTGKGGENPWGQVLAGAALSGESRRTSEEVRRAVNAVPEFGTIPPSGRAGFLTDSSG